MKLSPKMRARLARLRTLRRNESGLALVEFALSLPVFLALGLAGMETASLALANLRINQIAMLVADNAGRVRTTIDETDIDQVMVGAGYAGSGISLGPNGRVILSSLQSNGQVGATAGYTIVWQRCFGAKNVTSSYGVQGDGATDATLSAGMGPASSKIEPVAGTAVMFVEVVSDYQPVVSNSIFGAKTLRATAAFTVRQRDGEAMTNTTNLTTAQKRLCDAAHLSAT